MPLASGGGSLAVDSAPTEAVVGTSGTVQVSWSGLAPGGSYLGAVSHSDATGIKALTIVNIENDEGAGYCDLVECAP